MTRCNESRDGSASLLGRVWSFTKKRVRVELAEVARQLLPELDREQLETTQTGLTLRGSFEQKAFADESRLPSIGGSSRIYTSFRPTRLVLTEHVTAELVHRRCGRRSVSFDVANSSDLVLTRAFAGCLSCFPNAPSQDSGISGNAFSSTSLQQMCWPVFTSGTEASFTLAVEPSVFERVRAHVPSDWSDAVVERVHVRARLSMFGPVVSADAR